MRRLPIGRRPRYGKYEKIGKLIAPVTPSLFRLGVEKVRKGVPLKM